MIMKRLMVGNQDVINTFTISRTNVSFLVFNYRLNLSLTERGRNTNDGFITQFLENDLISKPFV